MPQIHHINRLQPLHLCFLTVSILILLAGCAEPTPPPEPVTIQFGYVGFDNRTSEREYYQNLADQFNQEYPHITVEVGFSALYTAFYGDGLSKDAMLVPDFIFPAFIEEEMILPLDGFFQQDPNFPYDDFYGGVLEIFKRDGSSWGLPAGVDPFVFYYNKDMFTQAGIPYPDPAWTWDDFLNAAQGVSAPQLGVFGYAPTSIFGPDSDYMESIVYIYQNGGQILDNFENPTYFIYDDPDAIEALDGYSDLYHTYDVAPTQAQALEFFGGPQNISIYQGIRQEKIGIWGALLSDRGGQSYMPASWEFEYGILPAPRGREPFNLVFSSAYVMGADTEHPAETWLWIEFLTEQLGYNTIPVRRSVVASKTFQDLAGTELVQTLEFILEDASYFPMDSDSDLDRDYDSFSRALNMIVNQAVPPEEAMFWASNR